MLVRRAILILMVLTVPFIATVGLFYLSQYAMHAMGRIITDPTTLLYMAYGEFALFTFGALMELRSRW